MRFLLPVVTILALTLPVSYGVTVATVRNFTSLTEGYPILGATGDPVVGSYAIGVYDEHFDFEQSGNAVRDGLIQFGNELTTFVFSGLIGTPNSTTGSITFENDGVFLDQNIYILFGNAPSLTESDLFGVFRMNSRFEEENEVGLGVALVDVVPGNGELVYGSFVTPSSQPLAEPDFDVDFEFEQGIQLVNVPEPSTGFLSSLAALALLSWRRR